MTPAAQLPPAPTPPPPVAPSIVMSALAPLLFSLLGQQGSLRRLLVAVPGVVLLALNHKIGLNMDFQEQSLLAGVIVAIVAASTAKEMGTTSAQARVAVAQHAANAAIATAQAGDAEPAQ